MANGAARLGAGLTAPFLLVYLHLVRHIGLVDVGLILAVQNGVGLIAVPAVGAYVDRIGWRPALVATLVVAAVGTAAMAPARVAWQAFVAAFVMGAGTAGMWGALAPALGEVAAVRERAAAFAVNYAMTNLGLGVGALIGGVVLTTRNPVAFQVVFGLDALGSCLFALAVRAWPAGSPPAPAGRRPARPGEGALTALLADRALVAILVVASLAAVAGFAQFGTAFAGWATRIAPGSVTRVLGLAFAANTLTVVAVQLPVLRYALPGRRRTDMAAAGCALFGLTWLVALAAGALPGTGWRETGLIASLAVFGVGETFWSASFSSLVNDLAPDRLRGRYNAALSWTWSVGGVVGPVFAGLFLAAGRAPQLLAVLAAVCALAAGGALALGRRLPPALDRGTHLDATAAPS